MPRLTTLTLAAITGTFIGTASGQVVIGETVAVMPLTLNDNDNFGEAVDIEGPISVVGAPDVFPFMNGDDGIGEVFLFDTDTGAQLASITDPTNGVSTRFGESVALDAGRLAIGAPGFGDFFAPDNLAGTAYLYRASDQTLL